MSRPNVFVSYSHKNSRALKSLLPYLDTLKRANFVDVWTDRQLRGGQRWREEIRAALAAADVAVLLISQEFLTSTFVYEEELPSILERQTNGTLTVLPVYVSPSTVTSEEVVFLDARGREQRILLSDTQGFGTPQRTLSELDLPERQRAFVDLHDRIRGLATTRQTPLTPAAGVRRAAAAHASTDHRPHIHHLPFPRNRNFSGREAYLRQLHEELTSGRPDAGTQALTGLGGIGKTQIALEYSYRYGAEYDILWWVRSEYVDTCLEDVRGLGAALGVEGRSNAKQAAARPVEQLNSLDDWLLVFDNTEHPDVIRELLPKSSRGHVIITSRYPAWGAVARVLRMGVWQPKEAAAYLERRTGLAISKAAVDTAVAVGHLPLALAQVAAYVEETGAGFERYLDLLKSHPAETLGWQVNASEAKKAVATVWDIALERVGASEPAAVDLLNLFAFLPSDGISRSLLVQQADRLPSPLRGTVRNQLALDAAIAALRRYSLVDTTPDGFIVHRLVQAVVQARLDGTRRAVFYDAATDLMGKDPELGVPASASTSTPSQAPPVQHKKRRAAEDAPLEPSRLWTDRTIPYVLSSGLTEFDITLVRQAIAHFEEKTVLRFTPLDKPDVEEGANYVAIVKGHGDSSAVGMRGGPQRLTIGSANLGNVIHSFGHTVGLWHEIGRADRDRYVTIVWENIDPGFRHNFMIHLSGHERIRPYDHGSIMHDGRHAFSANGRPTIIPKEDIHIGQRSGLSEGDVFLINALYGAG